MRGLGSESRESGRDVLGKEGDKGGGGEQDLGCRVGV